MTPVNKSSDSTETPDSALVHEPLSSLHALVLDIQATGQNPDNSVLFEMGWQPVSGTVDKKQKKIISHTIVLPEDYNLPKRIERITGITDQDFNAAIDEKTVWQKLTRVARQVQKYYNNSLCPAIIHYARFERPHLLALHKRYSPKSTFPFFIICTHDIARRLLPDLPRRGLRAVAGYFGYSVAQLRRASHHVGATAFIWPRIVELLAQEGVVTFGELGQWLDKKPKAVRSGRQYPMDPSLRKNLPHAPGIYRMKRSNGDILYVGKATSLKQRVNSYFQKKAGHTEHILEMLSQAKKLSVTQTDTALEAALLETDEIKGLYPPYNKSLKTNNRSLWYFSRTLDAHGKKPNKNLCIGPVVSADSLTSLATLSRLCLLMPKSKKIAPGALLPDLGFSEDYAPGRDILTEGIVLFFEKYSQEKNCDFTTKSLLGIGRGIWRQYIERKDEEGTDEEIDGKEEEREELLWTPEVVVKVLESTLSNAGHQIRRSRWYSLLCESLLQWQCRQEGSGWRRIVLQNGTVVKNSSLPTQKPVPLPPGYRKRYATRQKHFDVATYDRMRVLTTEIRRLVGEGRDVRLRCNASREMTGLQLERLLKWI